MMKFSSRKEQRIVNETVAGLLLPMKDYLSQPVREAVEIALRILRETEIEDEKEG